MFSMGALQAAGSGDGVVVGGGGCCSRLYVFDGGIAGCRFWGWGGGGGGGGGVMLL